MTERLEPTALELRRFIEVFERLDRFESEQRLVRGHGALNPDELPIPEVVTTIAWLRELAHGRG